VDPLFLGVFNVVSCCVLWFPGRKFSGTPGRATAGKTIYHFYDRRHQAGYFCIAYNFTKKGAEKRNV
jgi:hypothetical protein